MNRIADEDEPTADALGGTLSLTDTLEEDRERYQDVIRDLTEFEEVEGETEADSTTEAVHDLDVRPEITVA
jgi:hypothetical protein